MAGTVARADALIALRAGAAAAGKPGKRNPYRAASSSPARLLAELWDKGRAEATPK